MSLMIKNVLLDGKQTDVYVEGNLIKEIGKKLEADKTIDGKHKAIIPSFVNGHTHSAMTLLRGYADDMMLQEWLETKIWPLEAKLTVEDVYLGAKLACLEMIKSGTTFFNDMYWYFTGTARAVEESGIRAAVGAVFIDLFDSAKAEEQIKLNKKLFEESKKYSDRVIFSLGPHAIYTVSKESLLWAKEFAEKNNLLIHIHVSETEQEVSGCLKKHNLRPVEFLDSFGFLGENVIACHSVWLNDKEIKLFAKNNVQVVHNPISNMKLAVGGAMPYDKLKNAGINISLGTDGCASNNNLDMFESMKFASLLHKMSSNQQTIAPANEIFQMATSNGAKAFGLNAGKIAEGKLADFLLIDLKKVHMSPLHNLVSNLVYATNSSCVDTTVCDGKVLMENRKVPHEEEIIEKAKEAALDLIKR
ncbi:amidohydrolase [Candidatus Woesearchaeota archaeon]|nr:amidohydrolase [Candidatus Woesearchaeota archaeon]